MTDIFISYASADRPRVKPLVDALGQKGWSVWWDRTIPAGKTWDRVIEAALSDARCVIVLWSRDSVQSDWVRTEADEAKRRGILVPALLDEIDIPLAFKRIQAANLAGWSGMLPSAEFEELARAVSEVLSNTAPLALGPQTPISQPTSDRNANRQARFVSASVEWKKENEPNPNPRRWVVYIDNDSDAPITVEQVKVSSPSIELPIINWGPVRPKVSSDYELEESEFDPSGERPEVYVRFSDSYGQKWSLRRGVLRQIGGTH